MKNAKPLKVLQELELYEKREIIVETNMGPILAKHYTGHAQGGMEEWLHRTESLR